MAACAETKLCETKDCDKVAKLQCPTCIKLKLPVSYFCSQECFKSSWNAHKVAHQSEKKEESGDYNPWPKYIFTGNLRPYPVTSMQRVPANIQKPDYADSPDGYPTSEREVRGRTNIDVLNDEDQENLRTACKLGREVLDAAIKAADIGVTTEEIDKLVHEACIERECYPSPLNYYNFPKSCCTSVNEVICHGIPDQRPLVNADILNIDITVYHRGFHGDLNETIFIGEVSDKAKNLIQVAHQCLSKAIELVKPGVRYRDVGDVIQKHAQQHGYSVVKTYCGHGINRLFHTAPNVPHYAKNKAVGIMKPGHSFTIEPMISEGTWRDSTWPDNWTSVTTDGKLSAQFEHTLMVTQTGCDILTKRLSNDGRPHYMDQLEK